jgi:glycosyltransferase involved in cell wall biosynthesis
MTRIAFFTFNAYEMLTGGRDSDAVGGAQLQQILVAKELASRGHDVFFFEYDTDRKSKKEVDGIQIVTKPRPTGSELARAFEALSGTMRILREIDPDVCYRRVLNFELLLISFYCSISDARFIYGISHDDELTDDPHLFSSGIKSTGPYKRLNRYAISRADAVIAQNSHQHDLATRRLDTDIYKIPNCYRVNPVDPIDWEYDSPVVFWAARFQPWKQPEIVAELAEALPDVTFVMAGAPGDKETYAQLETRAESIENLHMLGHVPLEEIDRYFAAASIFLNTSSKEGFPNTFLQAWAHETPVASLEVDPNSILTNEEIGIIAKGSETELRERLRKLLDDDEQRAELGQASKEYLEKNHTVEAITDRYERVLLGKKNRR